MKRLYWIVGLLLVCAGLALLARAIAVHPGYVLFAYPGFRYESGLWVFLALLVVLGLALYLLRLLIGLTVTSGGLVNPWSRLHRRRRVRQASREGVIELAEGRWARAQQHLQRAAEDDPQPLMHYLGAARAANHQGLYSERDALLEKALNRQPKAELGIALTHAELQLASGQLLDAAQTLEAMRSRHPRHHLVLRHLQQLYVDTGAWSALLALLPDLRKEKVLVGDALASLERRAWLGYLSTLEQGADEAPEASLQAAWQRLSNDLRHDPELLAVYVERLRGVGAEAQAEEVLLQALKRHYDAHLVRLYGLLHGRDPAKQLQVAEGWLKAHGDDPALRLTLGRLCLHNQLWGKAREYLEASLLLERDPETCAELARLLAHLGDVEQSNQLFQEGLALLDRRLGGSVVVPARVG